jgi:O-acetyl-ADP-ribose deacetylase (regulator of RNase III)
MVELRKGDILAADAEALVNTVNCVGVMGRGIALQFRKTFPDNFKAYEAVCKRGGLTPGRMLVFDTGRSGNPRFIVNFPTKRHWRGDSRLEDIESGLKALKTEIEGRGIHSVAVPPLGCGLGGLKWSDVRPRIEAALGELPGVRVLVYEPAGAPPAEAMAKTSKTPNMTEGRATLLGLMSRYLDALMDPSITLLEIHKLMYFMQEAGQPLKLRYTKGLYGPYAENLRHLLSEVEGHFISGYADAADKPDKEIALLAPAVDQANDWLAHEPTVKRRFTRVADLVEGFETPFGMELLSTIHWVAKQEGADSAKRAMELTYSWNERKRMFSPEQIEIAWKVLKAKGWLAKSRQR